MQSPAVACREIEPPSSSAVPVAEKLFSPCRHWLVELEDRPPRRVWRGKGAQLADQRALGHFLQAQRGDDLVDVGLLVDDRLPVDLGRPGGSGTSRTARDRRRSPGLQRGVGRL